MTRAKRPKIVVLGSMCRRPVPGVVFQLLHYLLGFERLGFEAYYVEWHLREAWRELMFADEEPHSKQTRDPVAPARRSATAHAKAVSHTLDDGTPAHSFSTLMAELSTLVRNTCATALPGFPRRWVSRTGLKSCRPSSRRWRHTADSA